MMLQRSTIAVFMLIFAWPTAAVAQTWTTPDGFLSVTSPEEDGCFMANTPPEPFLVLWGSPDEITILGVMQMQIPPKIMLKQSSVEKGLAEEMQGEVTRLPDRRISGYEVWLMKCSSPVGEVTQAIVRKDGTLYKLIALTSADQPETEIVNNFIDSLTISDPGADNAIRELGDDNVQADDRVRTTIDIHDLSAKIGGFGVLLLIGIGAIILIHKITSK